MNGFSIAAHKWWATLITPKLLAPEVVRNGRFRPDEERSPLLKKLPNNFHPLSIKKLGPAVLSFVDDNELARSIHGFIPTLKFVRLIDRGLWILIAVNQK